MCKEKVCSKCGTSKPISEFYRDKIQKDGHRNKCKECDKIDSTKYRHTKSGVLTQLFYHINRNARARNMERPNFSKKELIDWATTETQFDTLYENWVASGYSKDLTPSIDRLNDYKSYTFDNIRLVTWGGKLE